MNGAEVVVKVASVPIAITASREVWLSDIVGRWMGLESGTVPVELPCLRCSIVAFL